MWHKRVQVRLLAIIVVISAASTATAQDAGADPAADDDTVREFPAYNIRVTLPPNGQWGSPNEAAFAKFRTSRTEIVWINATENSNDGVPPDLVFDILQKTIYQNPERSHIGRLKTTYKGLPTLVLQFQAEGKSAPTLATFIHSPKWTYQIVHEDSGLSTVDVYGILQSLKFLSFIEDPTIVPTPPPDPEPVREWEHLNTRITLPPNGHWREPEDYALAAFELSPTQVVTIVAVTSPAELPQVDTDIVDQQFLTYLPGAVKVTGSPLTFHGMPAYQAHFRDPEYHIAISAIRFYTDSQLYDLVYHRLVPPSEPLDTLPEEFKCFAFINPPKAPGVVKEPPPPPPAPPKKKAAIGNYLILGAVGLVVFLAVGGLIFNIVRKARE